MIAICIGHDSRRRGADPDGPGPIPSEWEAMTDLGTRLASELGRRGVRCSLMYRIPGLPYAEQMAELVSRIHGIGATHAVELHWDSHPFGSGCMGLHWPGSLRGAALAERLSAACAGALGIRDRGAIPQQRSWAAHVVSETGIAQPAGPVLHFLRDTRIPAAILETCNSQHAPDRQALARALESGAVVQALTSAIALPA